MHDDCYHSRNVFLLMLNRAFLYGDGFFESIYCDANGHIPLFDMHLNRMRHACRIYQIKWDPFWDSSQFKREIQSSIRFMPARIRVTVYREGDGFYKPSCHAANYTLQKSPLTEHPNWLGITTILNAPSSADLIREISGLPKRSACFSDSIKYADQKGMAHIKSISAALYVQAAIEIEQKGKEEGILLNQRGEICECLSSNLWIVHEGICYCPPNNAGAIQGVMQAYLLNKFPNRFQQSTSAMNKADVLDAEMVFCSNAVRGISLLNITG